MKYDPNIKTKEMKMGAQVLRMRNDENKNFVKPNLARIENAVDSYVNEVALTHKVKEYVTKEEGDWLSVEVTVIVPDEG